MCSFADFLFCTISIFIVMTSLTTLEMKCNVKQFSSEKLWEKIFWSNFIAMLERTPSTKKYFWKRWGSTYFRLPEIKAVICAHTPTFLPENMVGVFLIKTKMVKVMEARRNFWNGTYLAFFLSWDRKNSWTDTLRGNTNFKIKNLALGTFN